MSKDAFTPALIRDAGIALGVVNTTHTCIEAARAHDLASTSKIALGRLLSAAALCRFSQTRQGQLSLQVVCDGKLRQLYADVSSEGNLRGYIKTPDLAIPPRPEIEPHGRRSIAVGVGAGTLSVIRMDAHNEYRQSSSDLVSGEVDTDVENFLSYSDQIPSVLVTDVLLDAHDRIELAGVLIAQALPHANRQTLAALRAQLQQGELARMLRQHAGEPKAVLEALRMPIELIEGEKALAWKCRCSYERVRFALSMLGPVDLAEMVDQQETAKVNCEFCGKLYQVPPHEVQEIFASTVTAQA